MENSSCGASRITQLHLGVTTVCVCVFLLHHPVAADCNDLSTN